VPTLLLLLLLLSRRRRPRQAPPSCLWPKRLLLLGPGPGLLPLPQRGLQQAQEATSPGPPRRRCSACCGARRRRRRLLGRGPQQRATETMSGDEKKRRRRRRRRNRRRKKRRSTRRTKGIDIIIITGGAGARAAAAKAKGRGGGAPTGAAATAMAASILARGRGRGRGDLKERDRPREGRLSPVFVFLKENITYLRIELSNVCSPLRKVGGGQRGRGEQGELDEGGGAEAKRGAATTQLPAREIEFFSPSQLTFGFAPHSLVLLLLLLLPFSCSALSLAASTLRLSETASQNFRSL
jgi:hypothetical protein